MSQLLGKSPALSIGRRAQHHVVRIDRRLNCTAKSHHVTLPHHITMLSGTAHRRRLTSTCFSRLQSILNSGTETRRVRLASFSRVSSLVTGTNSFSNFVSVKPSMLSSSGLLGLRLMLPCNMFVSVGPTPDLFSSMRPSLDRAVLSTLSILISSNGQHVNCVNNANFAVNLRRCPRSDQLATFHG